MNHNIELDNIIKKIAIFGLEEVIPNFDKTQKCSIYDIEFSKFSIRVELTKYQEFNYPNALKVYRGGVSGDFTYMIVPNMKKIIIDKF